MSPRRFQRCFWILLCVLPGQVARAQNSDRSSADRARAVLKAGATDADPDTRREVAVALSVIASRDPAADLLAALAKDKDSLVREAAIVSIGELKDRRLAQPAVDDLDDSVPEVVYAAARTLFELKRPEGKEVLMEIVEKEVKAKSGLVHAKMRDVTRRMKRPKSAILFVARQGVGFIPVPGVGEGFSALSALVTDADFSARATALLVLGSDSSSGVRMLIEQAFSDDEWSMRAAAVQIAASRHERQWRSRLIPLFDDTNRRVRYRAAASYLRLEQRAAPLNQAAPSRVEDRTGKK